MRRLELTIDPGGTPIHPVGDAFYYADFVERADLWNWNFGDSFLTLLFVVRGDRERVEQIVADADGIVEYELTPFGDGRFLYYLVEEEGTAPGRALFERFMRPGILSLPPATWADGVTTVTVVADDATLQALIDDIPAFVDVEINSIGRFDGGPDVVRGGAARHPPSGLTPRQREAVRAGVAVGYYDVPRTGSHEDVAEAIGCAPSTAAEHLQKAEAALVRAAVGPPSRP